ncbi:MAG TPA: hypothetical protein VHI50_07515, partial [Micromonosporaceae bacterium]|nr:hypothetical protein [Micromonosporaceae bacterium]
CWRVSPSQTLHHATRWDSPHYAMRSDSPSVARLVVFLHGYTGTASAFYAGDVTPGTSIMASAVNSGYYAIALTHRSTPNVRVECGADMSCHLPTRATLVTGTVQEGSAPAVADMAYDDGIEPRLVHLLVDLRDRTDAAGGWGAFLAPPACRGPRACTVVWSRVLLAGHSQGGGHAAVMARQHAVAGVIMLASPTDHHRGRAATSYPAYTLPAGLSTPAGGRRWKGLIHAGDPFLAAATSHWGADRLDADAVVVTSRDPRCAGDSAHGCVIGWDGLYPEWLRLWWNRADARPERVTGAPTHATLGSSRLLLARIGTRIHHAVWDGAGWEPYVPVANDGLPAGVTPADGAPSAATLDGMDFVAIRGSDDRVYLTRRPSRSAAFGDWSPIDLGGPTTQAPALVAYRGSLYAFAARAGGLWYATSVDGVGWAAPSRIADPGTVLGGTAAIVAGGELHVYARTLDRPWPSELARRHVLGRSYVRRRRRARVRRGPRDARTRHRRHAGLDGRPYRRQPHLVVRPRRVRKVAHASATDL